MSPSSINTKVPHTPYWLSGTQIKPAPSLGTSADIRHIIGFRTLDERMRILMDVEKLMAGADMGLVDSAIHQELAGQ